MSKKITYLNSTLGKDEQILRIAELHWMNYVFPIFLIILSLLVLLISFVPIGGVGAVLIFGLILLFFGIIILLDRIKREFVITNKRIIAKTGIIAVRTNELRLPKVESVNLSQSILGRILCYSDLVFTGTGTALVLFARITDPVLTKTNFEEVIEQNK